MRLIATADDAGLHPGMTEGAIRAHREGIITACSLVANGAAFDDAVARLRDAPSLEVGVHLTLVEERPLTPMHFPNKYTSFVPLYLARVIGIGAIERELRAQIEKVLATGLRVTHPGVDVGGYAHWNFEWDAETRALCDPRLRGELAARGIELIAPSQL